ncbi:MAG TPA: DUF2905 domain-containing protein, partial [Candidatus Limnocylindrales bacterium]|jgi:hypothetical protein|nr:DUF2905 domain-containing protein [Candidatus Limnocylindrales bacterium]
MDGLEGIGRLLLLGGIVLGLLGVILILAPNLPFIGRLPGDIRIETDTVRIYLPLGTMLVVSLILTIVLNVVGGVGRR